MRSATWFLPGAALLILSLAGCTFLTGETLSQRVDDVTIKATVESRLAAEQVPSLTRVGVDAVDGTVFLTGIVWSEAMKERASKIARQIQGVRGVINHLKVESG